MYSFIGSIEHQIDEKKRIRIPKKLRDQIPRSEQLYFVRYTNGCIAVFPSSSLNERLEALKNIRSDQPQLLQAKRAILSAIEEVQEDSQGRIVLSSMMRAHAGITKEVLTIGVGDYIEIWAPDRYAKEMEEMPLDNAFASLPF